MHRLGREEDARVGHEYPLGGEPGQRIVQPS